ncbi:hypothetical protein ACJBU6_10039 [Exserohilum turcicum]
MVCWDQTRPEARKAPRAGTGAPTRGFGNSRPTRRSVRQPRVPGLYRCLLLGPSAFEGALRHAVPCGHARLSYRNMARLHKYALGGCIHGRHPVRMAENAVPGGIIA